MQTTTTTKDQHKTFHSCLGHVCVCAGKRVFVLVYLVAWVSECCVILLSIKRFAAKCLVQLCSTLCLGFNFLRTENAKPKSYEDRERRRDRERAKRNVSGLLYELYLLRVLAAFIVWRREVRLGGRIALLTAVNSQISLFICVCASRY